MAAVCNADCKSLPYAEARSSKQTVGRALSTACRRIGPLRRSATKLSHIEFNFAPSRSRGSIAVGHPVDVSLSDTHAPLDAAEVFPEVGITYPGVGEPLPEFNHLARSALLDYLAAALDSEDEEHDESASEYSCTDSDFEDGPITPNLSGPLPAIFIDSSPVLHTPSTQALEFSLPTQDFCELAYSGPFEDLLLSGRVCSLDGELPVFDAPKAWTDAFPCSSTYSSSTFSTTASSSTPDPASESAPPTFIVGARSWWFGMAKSRA